MFDEKTAKAAREARERYEAEVAAEGREQPGPFITTSSMPIDRVYDATNVAKLDYERDLALPGAYPFTRGVHRTGYRAKPWTIRMFAGFGSAEETNARYRYLIEHGDDGLSVAFDMPTLMGYDHDEPEAFGEFGRCGVAIDSLADMEILFDQIPLDKISTSMTINSPAAVIWAMFIAAAEKQGVDRSTLRGTLQNDILKEYIAQNEYIYPPEESMRLVVDTIEYASREMPEWNSISISGYHIREAGSTAAQELAFTLANGIEYVKWGLERGLDIDEFAPRLSFFFNCHNDFFEEIGKFRAARRIWARQMRERFGAKNPRSWLMRFHTQTAGVSLTSQQPEVNLIRTTIQALAGVLGGTQSLHTNSWDEALALPSEKAVRLAMRTQQVIEHESGVVNTVDPLGGSFFVESMTDEMERICLQYFDRIEDLGGVLPAIEQGFFMSEIADAAQVYQREIEQHERVIVGVNDYVLDEALDIPILEMDPDGEARHLERLRRTRKTRDAARAARAMSELERATKDGENVMPYLVEAAHAYCTVGEICNMWRRVFGEQPVYVAI
ncbi:MAG: methylmalonyl-CoA mutase family protein [Chloroflexi bacterium]|nr:methylmalonyl-CoA mutase family protein [Chloroflexota bacterium]MDA1001769.1 methylmalonyl-CoA mutase family protein [Chloroflexota bacterium]